MLLLPLVRAARSEARPLNFQSLALKAANFDSTAIPYKRRKENIPFFFFAEKKLKKRNILAVSGPYRGHIKAVSG